MSKVERAVVALIVAIALIAGLFIVRFSLKKAQEDQDAIMEQAMSNVGGLPQASAGADATGDEGQPGEGQTQNGQQGEPGQSVPAGSVTDPDENGSDSAPNADGTGAQQGSDGSGEEGTSISADSNGSTGNGEDAGSSGNGGAGSSGTAGEAEGTGAVPSALLTALASGDFGDSEVLAALGLLDEDMQPTMGSSEMTLGSMTAWMQEESMGALEAKAALQGAQAVAAGVGDASSDAERRAFAQSQGNANYQAAQNKLQQEAAELALNYLQYRDLLAIQEENKAYYQELEQKIQSVRAEGMGLADIEQALEALRTQLTELEEQKGSSRTLETQRGSLLAQIEELEQQMGPARAREERIADDLKKITSELAQIELDLESARKELETASQNINTAVGNSVTAPVTVTGELLAEPLPALTVEEAVAQAMTNRNELKGAAFEIVRAEKYLTQLRYQYAPNAPEVLEQQAVLEAARANLPAQRKEIEAQLRAQYAGLELTAGRLELAEQKLEAVEQEGLEIEYELSNSYGDIWTSNVDALLADWSEYIGARQQVTSGIAQLDLELLRFEHAIGVGTASAGI